MNTQDEPIALAAYETLAQAFSDIAETKAENGYNEHPAIRTVIGDVPKSSVLEAGCGPGFLARDLLIKGASRYVAFDVSPKMIEIARNRVGSAADFFVHDMAVPLPLRDSFDLVVSSLAMDYVRDWSVPLGEFYRLLCSGGRLVFSVQHPMGSYKWFKPPSAFGVHYCEAQWKGFTPEPVTVPDYYRSFEEVINPVLSAGFALKALHETRPAKALESIDPAQFQKNNTFPTFLVLDAIKP